MAIVNKGSQNYNQAQANQGQANQTVNQQRPQQASTWSFHNTGLMAAPIPKGLGSEVYNKLKTSLLEVYKQANDGVEIALIDMDTTVEPSLAFSCIIVALRQKAAPDVGVAYHIILIEATGEKVTPVIDNIANQQVEVMRVTSDALDNDLIRKATDRVRKAFPVGPWFTVDGTVVPSSFNPDDKYAVHRLALNAGLACGTELEARTPGFHDVNLAMAAHDSTMSINVGFNRQQIQDAVGAPMRSDILLQFESKKNNAGQGKYTSLNAGDKDVKVAEASAFVDLLWNPISPMNGFNPYAPQQYAPTQKYVARLVITNLESNFSYTIGSVLLALATSLSLNDNSNWIQTFRPTIGQGGEIDINDIGALNIEANIANEPTGVGTRIDTKADSFKLEDLGQLVSALIQARLIVSLDCPEYGPQTWYTSIFASAANGSQSAYSSIYAAADQLTNGVFSRHFSMGSPMFADPGNRIHLGTWTDRSGIKRDIRDIDYLAVCNIVGERNPVAIREWSDTFLRAQYPQALRLAVRKKMIVALTNETANFTGFAERVTFSSTFMEALSQGIRDSGLPIRVNTPLSGSDISNMRGVASFASAALLTPSQSFQNGGVYGYQQNFAGNHSGQSFRW